MIIDCHSHIGMDYHHAYSGCEKIFEIHRKVGKGHVFRLISNTAKTKTLVKD